MFKPVRCAGILSLPLLITSCGWFDSGTEWKNGPYALVWIDDPNKVTLSRDVGNDAFITRVDDTVFSVGWDGRYVVAKQHPGGIRHITNFYIVDSQKDSTYADSSAAVIGPLGAQEFEQKARELKLPGFSKTLASLE